MDTKNIKQILATARSPVVVIDCFGGADSRRIWADNNARHPKILFIKAKYFGVALQKIDPSNQFEGGKFKTFRYLARKAEKLGYVVREFDARSHVTEIAEINSSAVERQGRSLPPDYTDIEAISRAVLLPGPWYGVFDRDGILRAYCRCPIFGDAFLYSRILGEMSRLDDGIMYLLVKGSLTAMANIQRKLGYPHWAMYDMYYGGGEGLRTFKRHSGFNPERVRWRWVER